MLKVISIFKILSVSYMFNNLLLTWYGGYKVRVTVSSQRICATLKNAKSTFEIITLGDLFGDFSVFLPFPPILGAKSLRKSPNSKCLLQNLNL